jgi:predicted NBD/HSP70 family sugar kinase
MAVQQGGGADLARLRRFNEQAVLTAVRAAGARRVAEIAADTGLARASVEDVVRGLIERGWLAEQAPVAVGRGRPARRYRFRGEAGRLLGIDIGAYNIRAAVADLNGTVLASVRTASTPRSSRSRRLAALDAAVRDCLAAADTNPGAVWVTGVGTTGWVDRAGRVVLANAIPDWSGVDLAGHLSAALPGPVLVENDSKLAALAEQRRGAGRGVPDMVLLQAGRRTGIGLVIDGRLHRGAGGVAGDLSLLPTLKWESAVEFLRQCPLPPTGVLAGNRIDAVLAAAGAGDPAATRAVRRYVRTMAGAAAAAVAIVDPVALVLAGSLSRRGDVLLPPLVEELALLCLRPPEVRVSTLGADAVALGGVCLAQDRLESHLAGTDRPLAAPAAS